MKNNVEKFLPLLFIHYKTKQEEVLSSLINVHACTELIND